MSLVSLLKLRDRMKQLLNEHVTSVDIIVLIGTLKNHKVLMRFQMDHRSFDTLRHRQKDP